MTSKILYALLAFLLCVSRVLAAEIPDYPFVFVVGKADIDRAPNIATCSFTLRAREQDPDKAASIVEDRLKSVLATLKANHVTPNDIESFNIEKQVLTDENNDNERTVIKGYDVWRNVKFTVRQLASVPPVEVSLVRSPNITNIDCRFDRTDRATVEGDLLTKALSRPGDARSGGSGQEPGERAHAHRHRPCRMHRAAARRSSGAQARAAHGRGDHLPSVQNRRRGADRVEPRPSSHRREGQGPLAADPRRLLDQEA